MDLAGAGRTVEPGVEAGARNLQRLAEPTDWPNVTVLGNEGKSHVAWRAKKASTIVLEPMAENGLTLLEDVTLRPEPDLAQSLEPMARLRSVFHQGCDLRQVRAHLSVSRRGSSRGCSQLPHPAA